MDTTQIERAGVKPLDPEFDRIREIHDLPGLEAEVSRLQGYGTDVLFRFTQQQDRKDSTQVIAGALQGGMGLPERDYYFKDDEKSRKLREAYVKHIASMLALLGEDAAPADDESHRVMALETKLAQSAMTRIELRDSDALVLGESIADLGGLTIAYKAYEKSQEEKPPAPRIDGFIPEQRFFLSFAQVWSGNDRPGFIRLMVNADPHPMHSYRAMAASSNMPAFQ